MDPSGKSEQLCIGDYICLYSEERRGFLFSYQTSSAHNELAVGNNQHRDFPVVPNIQAVVFEICVQHRYKLSKKLPKIKAKVDENPSDIVLQTQYAQAKKAADGENQDNRFEQERQTGKTVLYGETIQLKHVFTGKWAHVNPIQTSLTETSSMMVELRGQASKSAFFKVMPRYKVKTEGEVVQVQDQIVLESIKTPAQFLHISRNTFGSKMVYSDCYELNLSVNSSGFTVYRYFKPQKAEEKASAIRGGSMVRFYHREVEAYVAVEGIDTMCGEDVHLRVRRMDQTNPKSMYPSTSSITYWQLEKERSLIDGTEIHWDDYVRIRHVLTRNYLMVTQTGKLAMTDDCQDAGTLFRLHPVVKDADYVVFDSAVRLEHAATGMWLHGFSDDVYKPSKKQAAGESDHDKSRRSSKKPQKSPEENILENLCWTTTERKQLGAVKEMMYDDAFSMQIVEDRHAWESNFVAGMVPFLHKLAWDLSNNTEFHPRMMSKIETALIELQEFMIIDGAPAKTRQKQMRNFMIVDIAVELLKFRTEKATLGYMEPVFASLISLLSVYLQGNSRKNELYMGRHMDFFLNQIGDTTGHIGLTSTLMTVELLQNNRKLVDRITTAHIDKICDLVKQHLNYRYLDLLSALCVCDGAALSKNQNYITEQLLINGNQGVSRDGGVFLITELGQNVNRRKNVVYISWDGGKSWQTLHDFTAQSYGTDYYLFLQYQLELFASLCSGRNSNVVDTITEKLKMITWEECYICMTDRKLADEIRSIYCRLLYDLFINVGTNFVSQDTKLVYVYHDVQLPKDRKHNMNISSNTYRPIPMPFMEPLKLWINDFLLENDAMIASEVGRNKLISEVLNLIRQLSLLGYYEDFKEVKAVLDPILGLLEGSDDLPYRVDDIEMVSPEVQQLVESYQKTGRFEKNTKNAAMVNVKISACHAAELLFNLRSSVRLDRFVSEFKQIYSLETTKKRHELASMLYDSFEIENGAISGKAVTIMEELFKDTNYVGDEFIPVALDLSRYQFEDLVAEAMFLLHRYYGSFEDLFENAMQTQILVTERSKEVEEMITTNLRHIRLMLADKNIDRENGELMKDLLNQFACACYIDGDQYNESHPINQQMLYNHGILSDIFDIITGEIDTEEDTFKEVMQACFQLLKALARGNSVVQMRLFDRLGTFLKTAELVGDDVAELFVSIFAGNKSLCLKIPPPLIVEMVNMLATSRSPTLIRLLNSLVMMGNNPLKRNQGLVIKALMQFKQSIDVVTDSTLDSRMQLLTSDEAKKGILDKKRYFANVVQLLAYCSQGDNKTVESICQSMFTLPELMDIILLPQLCNGLRGPFVQFLVAVFFTSDLDVAEFEMKETGHEPKLWTYIDSLCGDLSRTTDVVMRDQSQAKSLLKWKPSKIHLDREDKEHELKETLHYIFDAVLPFLQVFFKQYYQKDYADDEKDSMATDLDELSVDMAAQAVAERQIASQLLTGGLIPFAQQVQNCLATEEQLFALRETISVLSDTIGLTSDLPRVNMKLPESDTDPMGRYRQYYQEEQHLNIMLVWFVQNLKEAYGGLNTVQHQLQYPLDTPYTDPESDHALPLGREFQELLGAFLDPEAEEPEQRYANVSMVIGQIRDALHFRRAAERDKIRQEELTTRNLQVLRGILHNEIVKIPEEYSSGKKEVEMQEDVVEEVQNALVEMNLLEAVLNHISSSSEDVAREVLALLSAVLNGGNEFVQDRFMKIWLASREEPFFSSIKGRMAQTEEMLKERRLVINTKKDAIKEYRKVTEMSASHSYPRASKSIFNMLGPQEEEDRKVSTVSEAFSKIVTYGKKKFSAARKPSSEIPPAPRTVTVNHHHRRDCFGVTVMPKPPDYETLNSLNAHKLEKNMVFGGTGLGGLIEAMSMEMVLTASVKAMKETVVDDMSEQATMFKDSGHLELVLKVLAGLCDGQNTKLQDYLRDQFDNLKNIDIVGETANFLSLTYASINPSSINMVTQLLDTMIEMVQGNEANQIVVFDRKVIDHLNHMLRMEDMPGCSAEQIWSLKKSISILITDMAEENTASGHAKMIMEAVSKDDVAQVMYEAYNTLNTPPNGQLDTELEDLVMIVGFNYHHILCRALDLEPKMDRDRYMDNEAWRYFMNHTLSIEIQKGMIEILRDNLQRVYFTVEDKEVLRESVKERLKWEVERSSPSNKLRGFMEWAREVCGDIRYQRRVQSIAVCRMLVNNWSLLNICVLLITFVLNLVVLFGWMAPEQYNTDYEYSVDKGNYNAVMSEAVSLMIKTLGCVHAIFCGMLLASFLLANRPTIPQWLSAGFRLIKRLITKKQRKQKPPSGLDDMKTDYLTVNLLSWGSMYYVFLLVFSLLGIFFNASCFAFHMLHIANQNQLLSRVIQAVTLNGKSMLWVCFLGMIFFYIYAITGFLFLRNIFLGNQLYCHNMFECFVSTIRNGLMFGMADHFDIADDDPNNTFQYYSYKSIYDISFFALITTIGLNMIFGIIIDTFSQLRENKLQIEEDMKSNCFICNRESFEFEHHGKGFDHHVKEEHCMWAYLFFFIHLSDTPTNDLTSLELFVFKMINDEGIEFFPLGKALTLSQWEDENADTRMQKVMDQIDYLVSRMREQDQEKERVIQMHNREAKKQARMEQKKGFWGKVKKKAEDELGPRRVHATYGPFQYRFRQ